MPNSRLPRNLIPFMSMLLCVVSGSANRQGFDTARYDAAFIFSGRCAFTIL